MTKYNHKKVEKKWQGVWEKSKIYSAKDVGKNPKKYVLVEFPYPSGEGLHMGHLRPYVAGDVVSRYFKMNKKNVLYPIGWDAFGLPAENFAIKHEVHPKISTEKNIKNAKRQLTTWGISFDWSREINTSDPNYYIWTQWIFLEFLKAGLAYEATGLINWCPKDKTGLANEEVVDGKCERCGAAVEKKELRQWHLKITDYAEKLLRGLKKLNWPEEIKLQQKNWIGRSEGVEIQFPIFNSQFSINVFTTRPDTIFGATYLVVAPEHSLIQDLKSKIQNWPEVQKYISQSKEKSDIQRTAVEKEKTGIELKGIKAINSANKEKIPVWIADYAFGGYGTGAIMAVPAHDQRDLEFAKKFNLPISNALLVSKKEAIKLSGGVKKINYKLRDWVFSRQRYWGEPIPIIHCAKCGVVPVSEKDLPIKLPNVKKYKPTGTGESPLAAIKEWVHVKCSKCGGPGKRETNTMPQWAGSSWYYLRYVDPKNGKKFADAKKLNYWLPVDLYFGGMEHTTLHLLYSRFWHLFLYDKKFVPTPEPYACRIPHGIILGPDGEKMSKSRGNVVNPDEIVKKFGADTLRMYEMFLGPHEATVAWKTEGIVGIKRFLDRVWKLIKKLKIKNQNNKPKFKDEKIEKLLHKTIKKVTEDIENFHFNTAISALMILLNEFERQSYGIWHMAYSVFVKLLAPFAPHITEEIWQTILKNKKSIHLEKWPEYDSKFVEDDVFELIVQINGKVRDKFEVKKDISQKEAEHLTFSREKVKNILRHNQPKKVIFVPNRLINLVV